MKRIFTSLILLFAFFCENVLFANEWDNALNIIDEDYGEFSFLCAEISFSRGSENEDFSPFNFYRSIRFTSDSTGSKHLFTKIPICDEDPNSDLKIGCDYLIEFESSADSKKIWIQSGYLFERNGNGGHRWSETYSFYLYPMIRYSDGKLEVVDDCDKIEFVLNEDNTYTLIKPDTIASGVSYGFGVVKHFDYTTFYPEGSPNHGEVESSSEYSYICCFIQDFKLSLFPDTPAFKDNLNWTDHWMHYDSFDSNSSGFIRNFYPVKVAVDNDEIFLKYEYIFDYNRYSPYSFISCLRGKIIGNKAVFKFPQYITIPYSDLISPEYLKEYSETARLAFSGHAFVERNNEGSTVCKFNKINTDLIFDYDKDRRRLSNPNLDILYSQYSDGYSEYCKVVLKRPTIWDVNNLNGAVYDVTDQLSMYIYNREVILQKPSQIEVFDIEGALVLSSYTDKLDLSTLSRGIYIIRAQGNIKKIVI